MVRSLLAALALLAALSVSGPAAANGRFPASRGIDLGDGSGSSWLVPVTFGMLVSGDSGSTVYWVCEEALGYGGTFDPDHAITSDGGLWITSFDGVRVSRDGGCVWEPVGAPFDALLPGAMTLDADGRLWVVTAQGGVANGAYRNDQPSGNTFERLGLDSDGALFTSIAVAPSLTTRAYTAGFSIQGTGLPESVMLRTDDGGVGWQILDTGGFDIGSEPTLKVRAVAASDPDTVFASLGRSPTAGGDVLYRSSNAGVSFESVFTVEGDIETVVARANGDIVVGAGPMGTWLSTNGGQSFGEVAGGPRLACATEVADGTLYGCGSNVDPDLFAIGTSSDGRVWSPVFRLADIAGPLECPSGTAQRDQCAPLWPGLAEQLGLNGDGGDGGGGGGGGKGCCSAVGGSFTPVVAACVVLLLLFSLPRRRRPSRPGRRS